MKKLLATISLMTVLMVGSVFADGGLVLGDLAGNGQNPCSEPQKDKGWINADYGIIVNGFTGIIVNGFTGIIVNGLSDDSTTVNCGIIVNG